MVVGVPLSYIYQCLLSFVRIVIFEQHWPLWSCTNQNQNSICSVIR